MAPLASASPAPGLYAYTATVHFGMACFALWRMRRRVRPPAAERTAFVEGLQAATTVAAGFESHPNPGRRAPEAGRDGAL